MLKIRVVEYDKYPIDSKSIFNLIKELFWIVRVIFCGLKLRNDI